MVKFIAKPYHYLSYRLIPNYPITIYNQNGGITFNKDGEYITDDEIIITGLRMFINQFERAKGLEVNKSLSYLDCPIKEYKEDAKAEEEPKIGHTDFRNTLEDKDIWHNFIALLRQ